jgi:putative membrane protein
VKILIRWGVLALAVWAATALIPGIKVHGGAWDYIWVAVLFSVINTIFGSILKVLTFPAIILSAGLFIWVINAAMLELTAHWSKALTITSFWSALFAAAIISLITAAGRKITNGPNSAGLPKPF